MKKIFQFIFVALVNQTLMAHDIGDGNLTLTACTPQSIYDSGSSGGEYVDGETLIETYCAPSGNCLGIEFTSFKTEENYDFLEIFDGPNTSAASIGIFDGNGLANSPGAGALLISSSGCFTLKFTSDGSNTDDGWVANLTCQVGCLPTCSDGILNGSEISVDCGGPDCAPCSTQANIISTDCATETINITGSTNFYDPGGSGGDPSASGAAGNFPNSSCSSVTSICAPPGQFIIVDFTVLAMYNTSSAFDWMKIYDNSTTSGTILFNNDIGGAQNAPDGGIGSGYGDFGDDNMPPSFCSTNECLTFEFYASGAVNRAGWEASVFMTTSFCSPLGISLRDYYLKQNITTVDLLWTTKSEKNSEYFIIQKSIDGLNWEEIGQLKGAGTSLKNVQYSFKDYAPMTGLSYYRYIQVDYDGRKTTSIPLKSFRESNNDVSISIYPNPATEKLSFEFPKGSAYGNYKINFVNLLGEAVSETMGLTYESQKLISESFIDLVKGFYLVQVFDDNGKLIQATKLIKE